MSAPGELHTDMCERVHELLVEATEAKLWPLVSALSRAQDEAHELCPDGETPA